MIAILLTGCELFFGSPTLELRVTNESHSEVTVTISQDVPTVGETVLASRIAPGADDVLSVERPGPDPWTVSVDGLVITDSSQWPSDNPTLDFTIHIRPDGSVEVVDD